MAYNLIQLFALNVPTRLVIPFDLYAVEVPQQWKELFTRLQQHKLKKKEVLPPVECLNQALQLLIEDILFPSKNAFRKKVKWLYSKNEKISTEDIVTIVKTWLRVSFEDAPCLTDQDIEQINALSSSDLKFEKVLLPDQVWKIENGKLVMEPLYYDLIPYLFSAAIASAPLELIDPRTGQVVRHVNFRESVSDTSAKEVISWLPEIEVKEIKKKGSRQTEKSTHYYSYQAKFILHYHPNGTPYLNCEYGVRRWVSWELGYLGSSVTVDISPTGTNRFASCKLKYLGKEKEVTFEGNLARLLKELNTFKDDITAPAVKQSPYRNGDLAWAARYSTQMSKTHNAGAGFYPSDIEIFHNACLTRIQEVFGDGFAPIEPYTRCSNTKALTKVGAGYKKIATFLKTHFAAPPQPLPFNAPSDLQLLLLAQDTATEKLIYLLAKKYGITNVTVKSLGALGAELPGQQWQSECKQRIQDFQAQLPASPPGVKTIALIEILPKEQFWQDATKDPKLCFRPALAALGYVTDHFEPKGEEDKEDFLTEEALNTELERIESEREASTDAGKRDKTNLLSNFARRVEASLLSALTMAGAYTYQDFTAEGFPSNVACVGVYTIPFYTGSQVKELAVAVRIDKAGIKARAFGSPDWIDFYDFQVKMASGNAFQPTAIKHDSREIQDWVFNNLFKETKEPTLYCFDAQNLRQRLLFLQKKHWQKYALAFATEQGVDYVPISKYSNIRVACVVTPKTSEVSVYRACDEAGALKGHTEGVFYPSTQDSESGYYYLSNQKPDSRSGGILQESKLVSILKTTSEGETKAKKPKPQSQGYNPRGVLLSLSLQEGDCFSDWASFVQCQRLYGIIHYLGATNLPGPLHLASHLDAYRPIHAIRQP
ncbi:pPIWI_RE module domain-containing protein [Leptolyngbya sp. AN03gr2]|uniref:pPIWI_RE module domain-containing protein n=1 Tax=unclassified Leptolyngbya TaxID=2650499 RepID=UPI003D31596C